MTTLRRASIRWGAAAAMLACLTPAATAHSPDFDARFTKGAFLDAAMLAESEASADDLAFAARALLAHVFTGEGEPDPDMVERARRNAEGALALDPANSEGRLQLAIALSLKSRAMGVMDVMNSGYGERGKKLASEVLSAEPDNFYAHGFLAVWNIEVRRRGGSLGASFMGASLRDAARHYAEASRLAPDDVGLHWQYARALAGLDARRHRGEIEAALARALAAQADDRVEEVMQQRAVRLSAAMRDGHRQAQRLALELL